MRLKILARAAVFITMVTLATAQTSNPNKIYGRQTAPLTAYEQVKVDLALDLLAEAGYPEIKEEVEDGDVTIVSNTTPGPAGTSDHDTIAISNIAGLHIEALAAIIHHEATHARSGRSQGRMFDPTTISTPAGHCAHADQYCETAWVFCELSCSPQSGPVACSEIEEFAQACTDYFAANCPGGTAWPPSSSSCCCH